MYCLTFVVLGEVLGNLFISDGLICICEYNVIPTILILKYSEFACNCVDVEAEQLLDVLVLVAEVHYVLASSRQLVFLCCLYLFRDVYATVVDYRPAYDVCGLV
jgi:hypothetical protein